ncbi:VanZ family protein [Nocardioides sp.]|uniref:VanZ family protein n=1 Tax=Nocardioides sp. TaxID=35761 RepID=UPI0025D3FDF7|nr:VanZ family protein [Nocardioides sp.]
MFGEVPVLPVVMPLGAAVFGVAAWHLKRRGLLTAPRVAVALALAVYSAGIVANTVFPIFLDKPASSTPWTQFVNVTLGTGYELADAVMNVCVFVPVGMLVPLAVPRWSWLRVLTGATGLSLGIEMSQYATAHLLAGGHIADVNDPAFNVGGAALGLLLLTALARAPVTARLVDKFRWTEVVGQSEPDHRGMPSRE